jgi:hypothetical protein
VNRKSGFTKEETFIEQMRNCQLHKKNFRPWGEFHAVSSLDLKKKVIKNGDFEIQWLELDSWHVNRFRFSTLQNRASTAMLQRSHCPPLNNICHLYPPPPKKGRGHKKSVMRILVLYCIWGTRQCSG